MNERISINRAQAEQLLALFGGEDGDMVLCRSDKGHAGPGLYVWMDDMPEEGAMFLDAEPPAADAQKTNTLPSWFDTFLTNVCELSDRNSPAEEQDAIIATLAELSNCALNAIEQETK